MDGLCIHSHNYYYRDGIKNPLQVTSCRHKRTQLQSAPRPCQRQVGGARGVHVHQTHPLYNYRPMRPCGGIFGWGHGGRCVERTLELTSDFNVCDNTQRRNGNLSSLAYRFFLPSILTPFHAHSQSEKISLVPQLLNITVALLCDFWSVGPEL